MSGLGIPVYVEKSEISSNLNASILNVFVLGMYTVIYFGTMYIYFERRVSSKRYIVPATLTILFLCNIAESGLQWYAVKWQFVDQGDTQDSVFVAVINGPPNWFFITDLLSYIAFVLADGLLIWRCFFVWDCSFRIISLPVLLTITEIALFLVQVVFHAIYTGKNPNATLSLRLNNLAFAAFFTAFATSLVTTILITYRIYSISKRGGKERRFGLIINIVVQSGAIYSLSLLVCALSIILPGATGVLNTQITTLSFYSQALVNVIGGLATTVLVARVSMLPINTTFPSTSIHLSGLQFDVRSTHQTDTPEVMEGSHPISANIHAVREELRVAEKVL